LSDSSYCVEGKDIPYDKYRAASLMRLTPGQAILDPSLTAEERMLVALSTVDHAKATGKIANTFSTLNPAHLKMHLIKQALNYFIPKIGGIPEGFQPQHDVGKITKRIAERVIRLAEKVGSNLEGKKWEVNPLQNFIDLTRTGSNILIYIGEHDPHYLRWEMILFWNIWSEMEKMRQEDPEGFNIFEILANAIPIEEEGEKK